MSVLQKLSRVVVNGLFLPPEFLKLTLHHLGLIHTSIGPVTFQSWSNHGPVKYKFQAFQWKHAHWHSSYIPTPVPVL